MSANSMRKRIETLEARSYKTISTLADFVLWNAAGRRAEVEISPKLQEMLDNFVRHRG